MGTKLFVKMVTLEQLIFCKQVDSISLSTETGPIGIYPRHASLLTLLVPGKITVKDADQEEVFYSFGGIAELKDDSLTLLIDRCTRSEDIDDAYVKAAAEHAKKIMQGRQELESFEQARAELVRALGLLRSLQNTKNIVDKY
jgi:F-type H+-transporting ATPase subunit epsilon